MPKPMLQKENEKLSDTNNLSISSSSVHTQASTMDKFRLDKLLRRPRSKDYLKAVKQLDIGGHVHNQEAISDIISQIKGEFPEIEIEGILLGFVAVCYLGAPYEVHTLTMTGEICAHYKEGQTLPFDLEKARTLALRGGYEFVEVYADCCRAVDASGNVAVIIG